MSTRAIWGQAMCSADRDREEAAFVLQLCASQCSKSNPLGLVDYWPFPGAEDLAVDAAEHAARVMYGDMIRYLPTSMVDWRLIFAEAEALLRTGWSPGEER